MVSTLFNVVPLETFVFRNYNLPSTPRGGKKNTREAKYKGISNIEIWKAIRASTSAPSYFDAFEHGVSYHTYQKWDTCIQITSEFTIHETVRGAASGVVWCSVV